MTGLLPLVWVAFVVAAAAAHRSPCRNPRIAPGVAPDGEGRPRRWPTVPTRPALPSLPITRTVRTVMVAAATGAAATVYLPLLPLPVLVAVAVPAWRRRRASAARQAALAAEVPDVIDLVRVAVASGLNVRLAIDAVARRAPPGELKAALVQVGDEVRAGARLADALARLPRVGEPARPLAAALIDAERYGAALAPALDRLADEARRTRQRRAEEAARRVPVKLLFPLVACILPAFGLLTVAPLIAGGLRALRGL